MKFTLGFALAATGIVFLSACGPKPTSPQTTPTPEPTPAPDLTSATSPIPPPEPTPAPAPKILYVSTEFRAVSQLGTHEFPVGTEVELLEVDGEEYIVQKGDVAVRIHRTYFSEKPPAVATPPLPEPTPDIISLAPAPSPEPEEASPSLFPQQPEPMPETTPEPPPLVAPTPSGPLSPEEQRISDLTDSIREVDQRLRELPATDRSGPEAEKLRRQRQQLSDELTTLGKP